MSKTIPFKDRYQNVEGHTVDIAELDDDGELVWIVPPDELAPPNSKSRVGVPKLEPADTYGLIRAVMRSLPNFSTIHKEEDPQRIAGMYLQLEAAQERRTSFGADEAPSAGEDEPHDEPAGGASSAAAASVNGDVVLGDRSYEWLHALLKRSVPITEDMKARDSRIQARTFASTLWQNDAAILVNQLRDRSDTEYVVDMRDHAGYSD